MNSLFMFIKKIIWKKGWSLNYYGQRKRFSKIYNKIGLQDQTSLLSVNEVFNIYSAVISSAKIKGDIAEVGVFKGGSAKVICIARKLSICETKKVHLFDTYEGLPEVEKVDTKFSGGMFKKGEFYASLENVKHYLKEYSNIEFYKGLFPQTGSHVKNKKFSFVHLDVDIYSSTIDALKFFYPRMTKGGILISHDFPFANGVKKAFDEFFKDKPEPVISLINKQAMIVKV